MKSIISCLLALYVSHFLFDKSARVSSSTDTWTATTLSPRAEIHLENQRRILLVSFFWYFCWNHPRPTISAMLLTHTPPSTNVTSSVPFYSAKFKFWPGAKYDPLRTSPPKKDLLCCITTPLSFSLSSIPYLLGKDGEAAAYIIIFDINLSGAGAFGNLPLLYFTPHLQSGGFVTHLMPIRIDYIIVTWVSLWITKKKLKISTHFKLSLVVQLPPTPPPLLYFSAYIKQISRFCKLVQLYYTHM